MTTINDDPSPEILEAFLGKKKLLHALPHYGSRRALFEAYVRFISNSFGTSTPDPRCEFCESPNPPTASIQITWEARLRWIKRHIAMRFLLLPITIPIDGILSHVGLKGMSQRIFENRPASEMVQLTTLHSACPSCKTRQRARWVLFQFARYFLLALALIVAVIALILFFMMLAVLDGPPQARAEAPADAVGLVMCGVILGIMIIAAPTCGNRIALPLQVRQIVRSPFTFRRLEIWDR